DLVERMVGADPRSPDLTPRGAERLASREADEERVVRQVGEDADGRGVEAAPLFSGDRSRELDEGDVALEALARTGAQRLGHRGRTGGVDRHGIESDRGMSGEGGRDQQDG